MSDIYVDLGNLAEEADKLRKDGATALFVGIDGKAGGVIAIADPIKATTKEGDRHPGRSGRALPHVRHPAQPGGCGAGDGPQLGVGHRERAAAADYEAVTGLCNSRPRDGMAP